MEVRDKLYIDGAWVASTGSETIDVINSTTEEVMGSVPMGTAEDVDKAVKAASAAFPEWSALAPEERAKYTSRIGEGLQARMAEIANVISGEVGMPLSLSMMIQVGLPMMTFSSMANAIEEQTWEERVGNSLVVREATGVVGAITPWNYPLHQI
ncbi:MAG TPA: aldehyde dehydrogenase family protein, partial [Acidimicrobiales bacterium]|nr:aldehyde dehydrogenase family protein [Acidimicrobiales bacterium]